MSEELQNPDRDTKAQRNEHPSGWLVLTKNESVPYIVDALLDAPPHREFNQTELAELAGVSRQSVSRYLDLLVDVGIVKSLDGTSPQRYRFDPESRVSEALIRLDGAMNAAGTDLETSS
jgi:Fic family protein